MTQPERADSSRQPAPGAANFSRAHALAGDLLLGLPDRWRHTKAVARRAQELTNAVDQGDRDVLIAAAWLHDVGYAPSIIDTGFHPLDGARFLESQGWPSRLCGLVAHHSGARFVAEVHGLSDQLAEYLDERSAVTDALVLADQTVGAYGERLSIEDRLDNMLRRHGPDSANAAAHPHRAPYLLAAAQRVQERLERTDLTTHHTLADLVGFVMARLLEEEAGWETLLDARGRSKEAVRSRLADCRSRRDKVRNLDRRVPRPRTGELLELQMLALPYYDHPDYDPSWRPTAITHHV